MAVRIHYRHGLLHSSKDRLPFKVRATMVTDTNVTHFIQYTHDTFHFLTQLTDYIWLQALY